MSKPASQLQEKVGDLIDYIAPKIQPEDMMNWPPDAFAVAAYVLQKTGAYLNVVQCGEWPPAVPKHVQKLTHLRLQMKKQSTVSWVDAINVSGYSWRNRIEGQSEEWRSVFDATIAPWIKTALDSRETNCRDLPKEKQYVDAWLQVLCAADDAFAAVGFTPGDKQSDLNTRSYRILRRDDGGNATLCTGKIRAQVAGVLPKLHTPQTGITLRSLSHYLAFYRVAEVKPKWDSMVVWERTLNSATNNPPQSSQEAIRPDFRQEVLREPSINLLLLPWPSAVAPAQFRPAEWTLNKCNESRYGFFEFKPDPKQSSCRTLKRRLVEHYKQAVEVVGRVDGVVFPELAIQGEKCAKQLASVFLDKNPDGFFVAGVSTPSAGGKPGRNSAMWIQRPAGADFAAVQDKHHRWQLNRSQIENFGLGGSLNPSVRWWEHIELKSRELRFMAFNPWFTATALVCEDLARQEPISELIRAVGPSLVIALLMDGPQLSDRWPGRYATSLADDPGSSVLTLTSLGMAELSRPKGKVIDRTIALWKDQETGVTPIKLPTNAGGMVLTLSHHVVEEWTADGRGDQGNSSFLALSGVHPVVVNPS